jgi:HEAT repeat protein
MPTGTLIPMNRPNRLLEKARDCLADMEAFLSEPSAAVGVLLDALPHADTELILKSLPLLGYAGRERVLWPLFRLMLEASKDEQVCRMAAVQLGLAASLSFDPSALKSALLENLNHPAPSVRSNCAIALGWEGNRSAVKSLMAQMSDPNHSVRDAVIAALSSIGDVHVFDMLTARLQTGTIDEQRSILLNIWRFAEHTTRAEAVYLGCLETLSPDLRLDALSGLAMVPLSTAILDSYLQLLNDTDQRIRRQVMENISGAETIDNERLKDRLYVLLADKDVQIRQTAIRLLAKR